jgi:hypothetical protein
MPVYSENERRYRVQPSALPSRQLRHHSRHNPFPGIDLQFRLPSHPRPAVIGDFDNLIQLKVGSKSEGSLVLVLNCASIFFHRWTCEGARPTLCMTCCRWNDAGFSLASGTSSQSTPDSIDSMRSLSGVDVDGPNSHEGIQGPTYPRSRCQACFRSFTWSVFNPFVRRRTFVMGSPPGPDGALNLMSMFCRNCRATPPSTP